MGRVAVLAASLCGLLVAPAVHATTAVNHPTTGSTKAIKSTKKMTLSRAALSKKLAAKAQHKAKASRPMAKAPATGTITQQTAMLAQQTAMMAQQTAMMAQQVALAAQPAALAPKPTAQMALPTAAAPKPTALAPKLTALTTETSMPTGNAVAMLTPPASMKATTMVGAPPPANAPDTGPGTIKGHVLSMPWKEGLPEVLVTVKNTRISTTTDMEGNFTLNNVPGGSQQLVCSFDGFKTEIIPVAIKGGDIANVEAGLTMEEVRGEEIVVVGSKFPEKRLESPATVETVRPQEIKMMGSSSYLAALSQVKGVDYSDNGVGEKRISARGFNTQFNSRMLFMVDGRLASLPGSGLPQGALLPTSSADIHAVEVVVGPASALYGANAHTGVVNVQTKTPWDESGVAMSVRGGTQQMVDGSARIAGTVNKNFGFKINGQVSRANDWAPDGNQRPFLYGTAAMPVLEADLIHSKYNLFSAKGEVFGYGKFGNDWSAKAGGGWSLNDGFSATNSGRNHLRGWQVQYQTAQVSSSNWYAQVSRTASDAGKTYQLDRLAGLAAANGGMSVVSDAQLDTWRDQILFVDKSSLIDSELQYRNDFGDLKIVTGVQGRYYNPVSNGTYLADVGGVKLTAREIGGYLQADYQLIPDKFKAVAAARLDTHSDYSPQFSPKAALVYTVTKNHNVRFGYNRAFKSPTILENYLMIGGTLLGNKTGFTIKDGAGSVLSEIKPLHPERVDSIEGGYKANIGDRLFLDIVGYHSWYTDFISPLTARASPALGKYAYYATTGQMTADGTAAAGTLLTYSNFGSAQVVGGDVGADLQITQGVSLNGSVSYIRMYAFQNSDPTMPNLLLNVPQFKARAGATLQDVGLRGSFLRLSTRYQAEYAFASGRWLSAAYYPNGKIPARFVADVGLGYTFANGLKVSGNIYNVLDDHGVDVLGAPIAGRFAFAQLEYKWDGLDN